jgi:hypothetical protein
LKKLCEPRSHDPDQERLLIVHALRSWKALS